MSYNLRKDFNEILMTRALKKVIRFYDFSLVGEAFDPVRKGSFHLRFSGIRPLRGYPPPP